MTILAVLMTTLLLTTSVRSQDLDSLIEEVFGREERRDKPRSDDFLDPNDELEDCICVPYYLCHNQTIVTNGVGVIDIRVRQPTCQNYIDVCCDKPLDQTQKITPAPSVRLGCGRRNAEGVGFRITGDENGEAQFGEFPWMVAVLHEKVTPDRTLNVYECGGSLIHPQVVMTSAHCVADRRKNYRIRAGEWDTQTNNELFPHQDAGVRKVVIHPRYASGSLYNDVALLFLDAPISLAENVDTICLPGQGEVYDNARCFASGWGRDVFGKEGNYQVILKKVELPMVPRRECEAALRNTRLGPYFQLHRSFVCAGGEEGRDTCRGDGGSPLVCPIPGTWDRYVQVGIVAWGIDCGKSGTPGVYANVAQFRDWIDEQLLYHDVDTKFYEV